MQNDGKSKQRQNWNATNGRADRLFIFCVCEQTNDVPHRSRSEYVLMCLLYCLLLLPFVLFFFRLKRIDAWCTGFCRWKTSTKTNEMVCVRVLHNPHKLYNVRLLLLNFFMEHSVLCVFLLCLAWVLATLFFFLAIDYCLHLSRYVVVLLLILLRCSFFSAFMHRSQPNRWIRWLSSKPFAYVFNLHILFRLLLIGARKAERERESGKENHEYVLRECRSPPYVIYLLNILWWQK